MNKRVLDAFLCARAAEIESPNGVTVEDFRGGRILRLRKSPSTLFARTLSEFRVAGSATGMQNHLAEIIKNKLFTALKARRGKRRTQK